MLSELFERHRLAAEAHLRQIRHTDSHIDAGTITDAVWGLQNVACEAECAIAIEICGYRPADPGEMDLKARFLLEWTSATQMEPDEVKALLTSMLLPVDKSNNGEKSP